MLLQPDIGPGFGCGKSHVEVSALPHQIEFAENTDRYVGLVGGFGCGKSRGIGYKAFKLSYIDMGFDGMIVSRSGEQLDKLLLEVEAAFIQCGLRYHKWDDFQKNNHAHTFTNYGGRQYIINWGGGVYTRIYLGTAENQAYKRWAGGNLAWVLIDEIDTMPEAENVWKFANDRVRVKAPLLQTACGSTPEGYGWMWDFFENHAGLDRKLIRASTFDNPFLDVGYVRSQMATRDPASLRAYVYGYFVNLNGHPVYWAFDKTLNATDRTLDSFDRDTICHIGLDFNKNINATSITCIENEVPYTVDEIWGCTDTHQLIQVIDSKLAGRPIIIYPDASGYEGIRQLERRYGDNAVQYSKANPPIPRRVANVNRMLKLPGGKHARVNPKTASHLFNGLMRQTKDKAGMPDKKTGFDHSNDGYGYKLLQIYPPPEDQGYVQVIAGWRDNTLNMPFSRSA